MNAPLNRKAGDTPACIPTLIALAGALFLGGVLLSGCGKNVSASTSVPPPATKVTVVKAEQTDVPLTGEWVGTLDGYVNAQIQPQANGYLISQNYREGSQVEKGQILFEIDPRTFEAALQQAQGSLGQAQAQLALAEINVNRDTPLAAQRAIAKSQLDNDTQQKAQAEAAVRSAEAAVATAELNFGFTKVRSLITGVAGQATTQVGNLVSGQSVLTSVSQLDPIKVYFSISEQEYLKLSAQARSGGRADLLNSGNLIPLKLTLSSNQVYPHTGHIIFVDRSVTTETGSIRLAASFANPGNLLRPGQFGRVSAQTDVLRNAVLVPQKAVNELQGSYEVIAVSSDNVAHIKPVKQGLQVGTSVVILSGLSSGERVVTEGVDKIREGMKVAPQPEPVKR